MASIPKQANPGPDNSQDGQGQTQQPLANSQEQNRNDPSQKGRQWDVSMGRQATPGILVVEAGRAEPRQGPGTGDSGNRQSVMEQLRHVNRR